jgi:hypothetical protein
MTLRPLASLLILLATPALADGPGVRVRVTDARTGEPLAGASVEVVEPGAGEALTNRDGWVELPLESGRYELRASADFYRPRRVAVTVVRGGPPVKLALREDAGLIEEVVVVGAPDTTTEAVQIVRRQKAATVSDAISAEQISRTPDSSAGDAIKRVVAATVQDGKYIVVRGLGGRYSSTLLNGVALPSPDPDNPAAPLDLFPTSLLANLTINKTFSPDMPGNFAGGSLSLETREFPLDFTLRARASASADTATTFRELHDGEGGALDLLGFDDGTRALPATIPARRVSPSNGFTAADLAEIARGFDNHWELRRATAPPNLSFGATIGDTLRRDEARLGYLATLSYGARRTRRETTTRKTDGMTALEEMRASSGTLGTSLGGLVNLGFSPAPAHRLALMGLYSHSSDDTAELITGEPERSGGTVEVRRTRFRFVERGLAFAQLSGEHAFGARRSTVSWQGNVALTTQDEPDVRDLAYFERDDGQLQLATEPGSGDRLYAELEDVSGGAGVDLSLIFEPLKVKAGGLASLTERSLDARRFLFQAISAGDPRLTLPPEELFAPENMGSILRLSEDTRESDSYDFRRGVLAGYALIDLVALEPLRVVAGARVEAARQSIAASSRFSTSAPAPPVETSGAHVLPALNLIYQLPAAQNLRGSYSMTVARPHVRELAPYIYFDRARARVISGNPVLETTRIHNADLRYERFLGDTDLVAASLFYKRFVDPIETLVKTGDSVTYGNVEGATSMGGELEGRLSLPAGFRVSANLSLIFSRVSFDRDDPDMAALTSGERPLQGQSPYVANVELGWRSLGGGSEATLLYNVFGPRVAEAGADLQPDVYERPFHRVDVSYIQELPRALTLKLSATNLLAQDVRLRQGDVAILEYDPGVAFITSLEWSFSR